MKDDVVELISETYCDAGYVVRDEIKRSHFEDMKVIPISISNKETKEFADKLSKGLDVQEGHTIQIVSAYTVGGDYIGSVKTAKFLCEKLGIHPELAKPSDCVCSIGFSRKDGKWYGWSHRAIYGFKVGDKVKKGDCCASSGWTDEYLHEHPEEDLSLPVGFVAKSIFDAKRMAIAFAESVS